MSAVDTSELEALHQASFAWALACCGYRPQEAQDVLQSCYLKVLDGSARFEGRATLKTWFFAVIRRTAASRRRRDMARRLLLMRTVSAAVEQPVHEVEPGLEPDERARVVACLERLPRRQQEVLELVFYQDLSIRQAAGVMDVSLGAARAHYHRAKSSMLARLEEMERSP